MTNLLKKLKNKRDEEKLLRVEVLIISVILAFVSMSVHASDNNGYIGVEGNNYQGQTEWNYSYTGEVQNVIVPSDGIYQFQIYGAQGENYLTHNGGYGGSVSGAMELKKGDCISITVGGSNGYNGGGIGTLSNGGGATKIEKNGGIIAIAGGGGGATDLADGNAGGASVELNAKALEDTCSVLEYSAGGGGGYQAGTNGYIKYHNHDGNQTEGGLCYALPEFHSHVGDQISGTGCYTTPIFHEHEGDSSYYGGCYTNINYHEHVGNEQENGGCYTLPKYHTHSGSQVTGTDCYTKPVLHTHSDACPTRTCMGTTFTEALVNQEDGTTTTYYYCKTCGFGWSCLKNVCGSVASICKKGNTVEYYELSCTMDENTVIGYELDCGMLTTTPESYALACEMTEDSIEQYEIGCGMDLTSIVGYQKTCDKTENESIDDSKTALGGTNYYNSELCINVASNAGMNQGNGSARLLLVAIDGATITYYNDDASLLGKSTVAKGDLISYPLLGEPTKESDEKYSYTFAGWDDMNTEAVEKYSNEDTVKDTSRSYSFKAVYECTSRTYGVTFEFQGAEMIGTESINATYGQMMENVEIPQKENHIFAGYFSQPQGNGKQYYDSIGRAIGNSDITENTVLYAYWIQPLSIIKQPSNLTLTTGYTGIVIELDTILTANGDFKVEYQWYSMQNNRVDPIVNSVEKNLLMPENYAIGEYNVFCEIVVTDLTNNHIYRTKSDSIIVQISKGQIIGEQVGFQENHLTYDGKYHAAIVNVDFAGDYTIYYASERLHADNYTMVGQTYPLSFQNAGSYEIYYYITSEKYEDYSGKLNYTINKAKPKIYAVSKNISYTGDVLKIDAAKVVGVNGSILSDRVITYRYYTDVECSKKTSVENGAREDGGAPSKVGSYYVLVSVDESENYCAAELTTPVLLNIIRTSINFEIKGYHGVYDGNEHGVTAYTLHNNIEFYYATEQALNSQNYALLGTVNSPVFKNAGTYKVYYLVVNQVIGNLNSYVTGEVTITIQKAEQYITSENCPKLDKEQNIVIFPKGGDWEYRSCDHNSTWQKYEKEILPYGIYEFRLRENENYKASKSVVIQVVKEDVGNNIENEETVPELDKDEEQKETPDASDEQKELPKEEIVENQNGDRIPNDSEQDQNGNGVPDCYEQDQNGNGIPDYYEWDQNGNGIPDYMEDYNNNGIPDFLEWQSPSELPISQENKIVEIKETQLPLESNPEPKKTVAEKIKQTVKEIVDEENAEIVVPCVTVGMVIGLFACYFALVLLIPFIKLKTTYRYYIETMLTGKTKKYKVKINTEVASIDETRIKEGIYSFGQLCTNEDYIVTIQDQDNYSVGVIRLTFMKKRVFHEIVINQGIEVQVEQLKHGARIHIQ